MFETAAVLSHIYPNKRLGYTVLQSAVSRVEVLIEFARGCGCFSALCERFLDKSKGAK